MACVTTHCSAGMPMPVLVLVRSMMPYEMGGAKKLIIGRIMLIVLH